MYMHVLDSPHLQALRLSNLVAPQDLILLSICYRLDVLQTTFLFGEIDLHGACQKTKQESCIR